MKIAVGQGNSAIILSTPAFMNGNGMCKYSMIHHLAWTFAFSPPQ